MRDKPPARGRMVLDDVIPEPPEQDSSVRHRYLPWITVSGSLKKVDARTYSPLLSMHPRGPNTHGHRIFELWNTYVL
jgi:hypothetical protein